MAALMSVTRPPSFAAPIPAHKASWVTRHSSAASAVAGWPTMMSVILFLGGAQLVALGLIGRPRALFNYVARQLFRSLPRPLLKLAYSALFHRPAALDEPITEVRGWLAQDWPGFAPEPQDSPAA